MKRLCRFWDELSGGIFTVPQHLAELHGVGVALGGEHEHLAEAVQADGLPELLVFIGLHDGGDEAHAHRAGLAGDHHRIALDGDAQHPHAPGAHPVGAGDKGGGVVAQDIPGDGVGLAAGQAGHDGLHST